MVVQWFRAHADVAIRPRGHLRSIRGLALLGTTLILATLGVVGQSLPREATAATSPHIVLIVTDDQRWDSLWAMPVVQADLVAHGATFSNAFVVNSWCCPSRASILTGQYSHSTGVYKQRPPNGGFESFEDESTLATWLQGVGYRTGFFGKYLNGYGPATYVPPGWDRWFSFTSNNGQGQYYDYTASIDGVDTPYGDQPEDYSTDVLATEAASFITSADLGQPLFLLWTPIGPHQPAIPAPRHADAFLDLPPWRPQSYDEPDIADKPQYMRSLPRLSEQAKAEIDAERTDQYRALLAVDEGVGALVEALRSTGRLANTLLVFMSDNGYHWGEHRWDAKLVPYEESIRIPMVLRYDAMIGAPRVEERMVLNIDLAPTIAAVAGVPAPATDGRSLLSILSPAKGTWRARFLVEHLQGIDRVPTYCAIRSTRFLYVDYETDEEELYDLADDPGQLMNRATDPALAGVLDGMRTQLVRLCDPAPPGFLPG